MSEYYITQYAHEFYSFLGEKQQLIPENQEKRKSMSVREWAKQQISILCQSWQTKESIIESCSSGKSLNINDHILIVKDFDNLIKEMIESGLIIEKFSF
tara:strand:+ start:715 stop:1011 length:297 start_codon:yes stop_codon:yes gene_type:complete